MQPTGCPKYKQAKIISKQINISKCLRIIGGGGFNACYMAFMVGLCVLPTNWHSVLMAPRKHVAQLAHSAPQGLQLPFCLHQTPPPPPQNQPAHFATFPKPSRPQAMVGG